jgi:hypothetical protein
LKPNTTVNRTALDALTEKRVLDQGLHRPRVMRDCLRCERPFSSCGPQNRICEKCLWAIDGMGPTMETAV